MTYEQRLWAVLQGELPADILTEEEVDDLQHRVFDAIANKLLAPDQDTVLQ